MRAALLSLSRIKTEGVEQVPDKPENEDKGDEDGDPEDEDPEGEDPAPAKDKPAEENSKDKDLEKDKKDSSKSNMQSQCKSNMQSQSKQFSTGQPSGSKTARRALSFADMVSRGNYEEIHCANLLKAMELEGSEDEDEDLPADQLQDLEMEEDGELLNLPETWIQVLSQVGDDQSVDNLSKCVDQVSVKVRGTDREVGLDGEAVSYDILEEELSSTQPSLEEEDMMRGYEKKAITIRKGKQKTWGPIQV